MRDRTWGEVAQSLIDYRAAFLMAEIDKADARETCNR